MIQDEYVPRFIKASQVREIVELYHIARTALSGKPCEPRDRMLWASKEFAAKYPDVTETAAYKDLCGLLGR